MKAPPTFQLPQAQTLEELSRNIRLAEACGAEHLTVTLKIGSAKRVVDAALRGEKGSGTRDFVAELREMRDALAAESERLKEANDRAMAEREKHLARLDRIVRRGLLLALAVYAVGSAALLYLA